MSLSSEFRASLQQHARRHTARAAECLLNDEDTGAAQEHLEWVDTADRVLRADVPGRLRQVYLLGIALLAALTLGLLAWSFNPGNNPLRLEVIAGNVNIYLDRPWEARPGLALRRLSAEQLRKARLPSLGEGNFSELAIAGADFRLQGLSLPARAVLELESDGDNLRLFARNAGLEGDIAVRGGLLTLNGMNGEVSQDIQVAEDMPPEVVHFESRQVPAEGVPIKLSLETGAEWRFEGMVLRGLAFQREQPAGSEQWESSIYQARGEFLDTAGRFELADADWLRLAGVESARFSVQRQGDHLKILFQGSVDTLRAGPPGFVRELTPSWLEYLYHRQRPVLFWAGLLLLWFAAWRVRYLL